MASTPFDLIKKTFEEMAGIEQGMFQTYEKMLKGIKDEKLRKIIAKIRDDELKHAHNVQEILALLPA